MQCFTSQLQTQNYAKHIEALNTYRTYALPLDVSHAEAFYVLQPDEVLSAAAKDRWFHAVMAAAEVGAEALQLQVVQKDRQIDDLQSQFRADLQNLQQHADTWRNGSVQIKLENLKRLARFMAWPQSHISGLPCSRALSLKAHTHEQFF